MWIIEGLPESVCEDSGKRHPSSTVGRLSKDLVFSVAILNTDVKFSSAFLVRWPGIEPGSIAWKATMLTTIPPTHANSTAPLLIH